MAFLKEYEILEELGKIGGGSYAQVYKVRHIGLGYVRALRVLKHLVTKLDDPEYNKFLEESRKLLRLGNNPHPNIVHMYQPRLIDERAVWEMDYIEGSPVDSFIEQSKGFLPVDEVIHCLLDISSALAYCHVDNYWFSLNKDKDRDLIEFDETDGSKIIVSEENRRKLIKDYCIVHNDIKSNNVMRKFDGSYVLIDFGLSFGMDKKISRSSLMKNGGEEYKAPEKWDANPDLMSERTDIYSFGILLYEMLTGRVPFPADINLSLSTAIFEMSKHHKFDPVPAIEPLRRAAYENLAGTPYKKDYPDWLEQVIMKCLEKKPENRYANGKELYEEIKPLLEKSSPINNTEVENLKKQNKTLTDKLNKLSHEKQQLAESKSVIVEKVIEKPIEKIVTIEKPIEIVKRVTHPLWVFLTILFLISTVIGGYMYAQKPNISDINGDEVLTSNLKSERDSLQQQLNKKQTEVEQLNNQIKSLKQQLPIEGNDLSKQKIIDEKDKEITQLKNSVKLLETDNSSLKNQLNTSHNIASGNTTDLQKQINNLNSQINKLKITIIQRDNTIAEKQRQIDIFLKNMK